MVVDLTGPQNDKPDAPSSNAFLYQFYSILGELASTIHMSSFRHCDQGQALELPGHIWYQLRGKALAPRNSASSTLGSLFL